MTPLPKWIRRATQRAEKWVQRKEYDCLYPGCTERAVRCHSIQRAACSEALAAEGHVYTLAPSFVRQLLHRASDAPGMAIVKLGVKKAGTFKGYCAAHDRELFYQAESPKYDHRTGMFIALHFRSVSIEVCRKRRTADFLQKLAELVRDEKMAENIRRQAEGHRAFMEAFQKLYLANLFGLIFGVNNDTIEHFCLPFSRNLQVSCCGMFNVRESIDSALGFNLISFSDLNFLSIATFGDAVRYLDEYLAAYPIPQGAEDLVNDIAFRKCEEPLIAPTLWEKLDGARQAQIALNLRPPADRWVEVGCDVVRLRREDFVQPTPDHLSRLYRRIFLKPGQLEFHAG